jgi:hypothetical protein
MAPQRQSAAAGPAVIDPQARESVTRRPTSRCSHADNAGSTPVTRSPGSARVGGCLTALPSPSRLKQAVGDTRATQPPGIRLLRLGVGLFVATAVFTVTLPETLFPVAADLASSDAAIHASASVVACWWMIAARIESWPMQAIRSLVLTPLRAARVLPRMAKVMKSQARQAGLRHGLLPSWEPSDRAAMVAARVLGRHQSGRSASPTSRSTVRRCVPRTASRLARELAGEGTDPPTRVRR